VAAPTGAAEESKKAVAIKTDRKAGRCMGILLKLVLLSVEQNSSTFSRTQFKEAASTLLCR
jgi:hypothetical protein